MDIIENLINDLELQELEVALEIIKADYLERLIEHLTKRLQKTSNKIEIIEIENKIDEKQEDLNVLISSIDQRVKKI